MASLATGAMPSRFFQAWSKIARRVATVKAGQSSPSMLRSDAVGHWMELSRRLGRRPRFIGPGSSGGGAGGPGVRVSPGKMLLLTMGAFFLTGSLLADLLPTTPRQVSYQWFRTNALEEGLVKSIEIFEHEGGAEVVAHLRKSVRVPTYPGMEEPIDIWPARTIGFAVKNSEVLQEKLERHQAELGVPPEQRVPVQTHLQEHSVMLSLLGALIGPLLLLGGMYYFSRRGGSLDPSKLLKSMRPDAKMDLSRAKSSVKFADVAGNRNAKREIAEFVSFLKRPERFRRVGAKMPKGVLLDGPPGTGKTLLAKAVAGEAGVPFFSVSASAFEEVYVGVGAGRVRKLFEKARQHQPAVVFIDEIDAVGGKRRSGSQGGNDQTLNQLLSEMDGFDERDQIVVMAATNRPDMLDPALKRPGRFDRAVTMALPSLAERQEILHVHLRGKQLAAGVDPGKLASHLAGMTPGFSGADIANVANEAAILAARRGAVSGLAFDDFLQALDRVIGGLKRDSKLMSEEERKIVAHHEAGHAVVSWMLPHAHPLLKVTIEPRTNGALGFAQYMPREVSLYTRDELVESMCVALGGRAAEEIMFGRVTTGASDDLDKVTQRAYDMVKRFGMSSTVGQFNFTNVEPSSDMSDKIDSEAKAIIDEAWKSTMELAQMHRDKIEALASALLEQTTLEHDEIVRVLGTRPHTNEEYNTFLSNLEKRKDDFREDTAEKDDEEKQGPKVAVLPRKLQKPISRSNVFGAILSGQSQTLDDAFAVQPE